MSRKDLSRTVIEGGRYYRNCWERRHSHSIARARTRAWLSTYDPDDDADDPVPPPHVRKEFHDKLSPAMRWLAAQVGRPWDKVRSELTARFDSRTVAGNHVLNDHMLGAVVRHDDPIATWRTPDLIIDRHGILRRSPWADRSWANLRAEADALIRRRRIVNSARGLCWWQPIHGPRCTGGGCPRQHVALGREHYHELRWRLDGPVTRGDLRAIARLPPSLRPSW